MEEKRIALLIDSDNVSSDYLDSILDEVTKYGVVTYKRIYGDWTDSRAKKLKDKLLENSITSIQQFANTVGKNATNSALIIDAMDILYTGKVEGFCIVSSDSDFTRLASRLREGNMLVIGMGEDKTPKALVESCNKFINLSVVAGNDRGNVVAKNMMKKSTIEKRIKNIINENEDKNKTTDLGELGSKLSNIYSDFDVRNYGNKTLSEFLSGFDSLKLTRKNTIVTVSLKK